MSEANRALMIRWFEEVWNQGKESTIDELAAPDVIGHGLADGDVDLHGTAEFKPFVRNMRGAFPDIHISLEDIVVERDMVYARLSVHGTHQGANIGVPPTGRRVHIKAITQMRIAGGQIVEGWNSWDQLGLLRQIGALPAAEKPDRFAAKR